MRGFLQFLGWGKSTVRQIAIQPRLLALAPEDSSSNLRNIPGQITVLFHCSACGSPTSLAGRLRRVEVRRVCCDMSFPPTGRVLLVTFAWALTSDVGAALCLNESRTYLRESPPSTGPIRPIHLTILASMLQLNFWKSKELKR